jgi:hypothetical protein
MIFVNKFFLNRLGFFENTLLFNYFTSYKTKNVYLNASTNFLVRFFLLGFRFNYFFFDLNKIFFYFRRALQFVIEFTLNNGSFIFVLDSSLSETLNLIIRSSALKTNSQVFNIISFFQFFNKKKHSLTRPGFGLVFVGYSSKILNTFLSYLLRLNIPSVCFLDFECSITAFNYLVPCCVKNVISLYFFYDLIISVITSGKNLR